MLYLHTQEPCTQYNSMLIESAFCRLHHFARCCQCIPSCLRRHSCKDLKNATFTAYWRPSCPFAKWTCTDVPCKALLNCKYRVPPDMDPIIPRDELEMGPFDPEKDVPRDPHICKPEVCALKKYLCKRGGGNGGLLKLSIEYRGWRSKFFIYGAGHLQVAADWAFIQQTASESQYILLRQ